LVLTVALFGLGACLALPLSRPRSGITQENFDRIQEGITEAEVEEILGGPSGYYTRRPIVVPMSGVMFRRWWIGDEGVITIELTFETDPDEPRRVCHKRFAPVPPKCFAERYRRLLLWW
jgi:hypothetical protein